MSVVVDAIKYGCFDVERSWTTDTAKQHAEQHWPNVLFDWDTLEIVSVNEYRDHGYKVLGFPRPYE